MNDLIEFGRSVTDGKWRWHLNSADGEALGASHTGFASLEDATANATRVTGATELRPVLGHGAADVREVIR